MLEGMARWPHRVSLAEMPDATTAKEMGIGEGYDVPTLHSVTLHSND